MAQRTAATEADVAAHNYEPKSLRFVLGTSYQPLF